MSDKWQMNAPGVTDVQAAERAFECLDDAEWEEFKHRERERCRVLQSTVLAAGGYQAEAAIVFLQGDYWRGLAALLENNFTVGTIDDVFLLRRGFSPEVVAEHGFDEAWVVAFTTTRLDRDAFMAWVRTIVGPFGGEVEDASEIPCDLLNPRPMPMPTCDDAA